jgi:hypothetical protein
MNVFSPRELRKTSKGRFLNQDYHTIVSKVGILCPEAVFFLQAQVRAVLNHSWSI